MIKTLGNNIVSAFTGGNPVKAIYASGPLVWPVTIESSYYIKWTPSSAEGQFNIDGTTHNLSTFGGIYYWSTGIINSGAFKNNKYIQSIETNATSIGSYAFQSCSSLSQASLSMCKYVANSAFQLTSLLQLSLPVCSYIGNIAFRNCSSLSQVNLPMCKFIGNSAFHLCTSLSQLSLPVCSYIGSNAFRTCSSLSQVNLPMCSYISSSAFQSCRSLSQLSLPVCSYIGSNAFDDCRSLKQLILPECNYIGRIAFYSCRSLAQASLPVCSYIGEYAFGDCSSLSRITIGYSGVCSLDGISVFDGTKITSSIGSIYVPTSLVNAYKSAVNWSNFSSRIFPIES